MTEQATARSTTRGALSRGGSVLIGALAVDSLGNGLFLPLSLVYFTELTDVPLALLGVLLSVASAVTLPFPMWAGALADRIGPMPLVIGAQIAQALGYLGYVWVSGPVGVFLAVLLVTTGVRFFWSSIFTLLADYADSDPAGAGKDTWYAWANMARTAGFAVGGLVTGAAVAGGSESVYRAVAFGTAGCFAVAAATLATFVRAPRKRHEPAEKPEAPEERGGYRAVLRDTPFLGLTAVNTVYCMSSTLLALALPTVTLHALDGPGWLTSAILVGNALLIAILATPVVRRVEGYRRTRTMMAAAMLWAAWCLWMALLGPWGLGWLILALACATLLFTVAEAMHAPVSMALAASVAPGRLRGRYLAFFQYSFTLSGIVAPTFFTTLFEWHHAAPWLALGLINCVSVLAMTRLERRLPAAALRSTG